MAELPDAQDSLEDYLREAVEDDLPTDDALIVRTQRYAPGSGPHPSSVVIEVRARPDGDLGISLIDEVHHEFVGRQNNLVFGAIQQSHETLQSYGGSHEYHVNSITDSFAGVTVDRTDQTLTVRYGWSHPAAPFMDRGTSDHTINGSPVLSFVWEERHDPPQWVREGFEQEGDGWRVFLRDVEVAGLPESRFVRAGRDQFRREIE